MIRWLYAFIDRPTDAFERGCEFWTSVTGTGLSARRGEFSEFATLLPGSGDPYLKVQAVGDGGGVHLDLAVAEVPALVHRATGLGATVEADHGNWAVLRSPNGQLFCAVPWHGEIGRPQPHAGPPGVTSRLDQVTLDVQPSAFEAEVAFWVALTGWESQPGSLPKFHRVKPPDALPIRLLVQRLDSATDGPGTAHPDFACSDVAGVRAWHESLGATVVREWPLWTVMRDPAGGVYCLTARDPATGGLPG